MPSSFRWVPGVVGGLVVCVGCVGLVGVVRAEDEKPLADRIAAFEKQKTAADKAALQAFEKLVKNVKADTKIKEAVRQELLEKLSTARSDFQKVGRWPNNAAWELVDDEFTYNKRLGDALTPLSTEYERLIKLYRAKDDDAAVKRLLADRQKLIDANFRGQDGFKAGTVWKGQRVGPKGNTVVLHMKLNEVKEATFEGVINQNPGVANHPIYEVNGVLEGNKLVFRNAKMVRGEGRAVEFSGYLSVNRMFLHVGGLNTKGRPVDEYAMLEK